MRKIAIVYGGVSGAVIIGVMSLTIALSTGGEGSMQSLQLLGYLVMLVGLSVVFVGIKRYRDREQGGVIRFGTAFKLGLGIVAVASVVYVALWEVNLAVTDYAFIEDYSESVISDREAAGATPAEMDALRAEVAIAVERMGNPLFRIAITFLEIFPVGLVIALVSAALLKNSGFMPARGAS